MAQKRGQWLNRQEFVVVGWSDPEGTRSQLAPLMMGYYTDDGKLIYAGRVGTGMPVKVLADLRRRLDPHARKTPPLNACRLGKRVGSRSSCRGSIGSSRSLSRRSRI